MYLEKLRSSSLSLARVLNAHSMRVRSPTFDALLRFRMRFAVWFSGRKSSEGDAAGVGMRSIRTLKRASARREQDFRLNDTMVQPTRWRQIKMRGNDLMKSMP